MNNEVVFKVCTCGKTYTRSEWNRLLLLGVQCFHGRDGAQDIELRNCTCHSTMGVELPCPHQQAVDSEAA